jgi:hypothetical protein
VILLDAVIASQWCPTVSGVPPPAPHLVDGTGRDCEHGEAGSTCALYHRSNSNGVPPHVGREDVLIDEIKWCYDGPVVAAQDLDVF